MGVPSPSQSHTLPSPSPAKSGVFLRQGQGSHRSPANSVRTPVPLCQDISIKRTLRNPKRGGGVGTEAAGLGALQGQHVEGSQSGSHRNGSGDTKIRDGEGLARGHTASKSGCGQGTLPGVLASQPRGPRVTSCRFTCSCLSPTSHIRLPKRKDEGLRSPGHVRVTACGVEDRPGPGEG